MGQVTEIFSAADENSSSHESIVILDIFAVASRQHEIWKMPYLYCQNGENRYVIVSTKVRSWFLYI